MIVHDNTNIVDAGCRFEQQPEGVEIYIRDFKQGDFFILSTVQQINTNQLNIKHLTTWNR